MSRLTTQLTFQIAGMRGPAGIITADLAALEANVVELADRTETIAAAAQSAVALASLAVPGFTFGLGFATVDKTGRGFVLGPPSSSTTGASSEIARGFTFGMGLATVDARGAGSAVIEPAGVGFIPQEIGTYPARDVAMTSNFGTVRLTYSQGDNAAPQVTPTGVRWVNTSAAGASSILSVDLPANPAPVAAGVTEISMIAGIGQSLSIGAKGGTPDPDGIIDPSGHLMMFSGGIMPGADNTTTPIPDSRLGPLVPLQAGAQERSVYPRAGNRLRQAVGASKAILMGTFGVGGAAYGSLLKGTVPYSRLVRAMLRARLLAWTGRLPVKMRGLICIHGEADREALKATYMAWLNVWRSDFQTDARAIWNDAGLILPMFVSQVSSWTHYNIARSEVPLAQLQVALDSPALFFMVGPKYHLPYVDNQHLTGPGYAQHGEEIGRALAAVANGGTWDGSWSPLRAGSATRSGTTITVTTVGGVGNTVIDTGVVSDPGNFGVTYRDGSGAQVAVSGVTVSGSTIQFTIASAVAGVAEFGMRGIPGNGGGPTTGPRTCFRDSSTDTYADGTTMSKWMAHCEVPVA
ncbi:hypothetical protein [Novosphingobium gossypii]|uniref:hypothetical protein n=1 Tax=Novosphingobium gossypii TaxID=1604774 RepID=UPI003D194E12